MFSRKILFIFVISIILTSCSINLEQENNDRFEIINAPGYVYLLDKSTGEVWQSIPDDNSKVSWKKTTKE